MKQVKPIHAAAAGEPEWMPIGDTLFDPIVESNRELVSRGTPPHQLLFVQLEKPDKAKQRWDGRLTHSDRANRRRFDDDDLAVHPAHEAVEINRGHPTRGPATHDDKTFNPVRWVGAARHHQTFYRRERRLMRRAGLCTPSARSAPTARPHIVSETIMATQCKVPHDRLW